MSYNVQQPDSRLYPSLSDNVYHHRHPMYDNSLTGKPENGPTNIIEMEKIPSDVDTPPRYNGHIPVNKYYEAEPDKENLITKFQNKLSTIIDENFSFLVKATILLLVIGYFVYFIFALLHDADKSTALIVLTPLVCACICYSFIKQTYGEIINEVLIDPSLEVAKRYWPTLKW